MSVTEKGPDVTFRQFSLILTGVREQPGGKWAMNNRPGHLLMAPKFFPQTPQHTQVQVLTSYGGEAATELMRFKTSGVSAPDRVSVFGCCCS